MGEADLSKIVGLIMENPSLIAEIRALAEKSEDSEEAQKPPETEAASIPQRERIESVRGTKRRDLLLALKPYLSKERGKAVEEMLSIIDVLDMMRKR